MWIPLGNPYWWTPPMPNNLTLVTHIAFLWKKKKKNEKKRLSLSFLWSNLIDYWIRIKVIRLIHWFDCWIGVIIEMRSNLTASWRWGFYCARLSLCVWVTLSQSPVIPSLLPRVWASAETPSCRAFRQNRLAAFNLKSIKNCDEFIKNINNSYRNCISTSII